MKFLIFNLRVLNIKGFTPTPEPPHLWCRRGGKPVDESSHQIWCEDEQSETRRALSQCYASTTKGLVWGFTIVEVLAVIAIAGVIAMICFTALIVLEPSLQLGSFTNNLTTDLRYAQQMAVAEQVNYGVYFSVDDKKYRIVRYGTSTVQIVEKFLPAKVYFAEISGFTDQEVIFNPYGAVQESGTISLVNDQGKEKHVNVRPSGFVKVSD